MKIKILAPALLAVLFLAAPAVGQEALSPTPVLHFVDNNGNALTGGKLFVYGAGTNTKINSYTSSSGVTPNQNPVVLNTRGEANVWLTPGTLYKFVLSPSTDSDPPTNPIWTVDNIFANASGGSGGGGNTGVVVTTSTSINSAINTISVNATGSTTQTLPASPALWETHAIVDGAGNAATFPITVAGNGNQISGQPNFYLTFNRQAISIQWDGAQWNVSGNPALLPVTATIASLRLISAAAAPQYINIQVQDYYGTGNNCPIQYRWNASDTRSDDGGAVINPTGNSGNGRWNLTLQPNSPLHTCVYGVKVDSPAAVGTGTDNTTQLQGALTWAATYGPNRVHLDSLQGYCIKIASHITPAQGEIIEGDGMGDYNHTIGTGSCLNYTGIPGTSGEYAIQLQTPFPGLGTTDFESPKFRDFTINYFSDDTNPGGCIQLNSIAGGFTDTTASQQGMAHPEVSRVYCLLRESSGSNKIGFQCSKCTDGSFDGTSVFGGLNGFDIEGSENIRISGGRVTATYGSDVILNQQGSFGQINSVVNMQLLGPANFGQTVDSIIFDSARSSVLENNFLESLSGVTVTSAIHLTGGFTAGIYNNADTLAAVTWLKVDTKYNNITAYGNGGYGGVIGQAIFLAGNSLDTNSVAQILSHWGNGVSADSGWPFNSQLGLDVTFAPKVEQLWAPAYGGLTAAGYGPSEIPVNSAYTFPTTGSSNFLAWTNNRLPAATGTFDLEIHAWQTTGAGQITCQLTDNGSTVGSTHAFTLTAAPQWLTWTAAQAITTGAGVTCYDTGGSTSGNPSKIDQIQLTDH